ncbi:M64 family metallopeptidase [Gaoshiqia sediminis]|uniref:IgA Peptidase M64 n=1 Tax=Gaoshiqia sediminis TaxID=2986998 RepID=A0AA41Y407_9BACT|nr:M64 family metallopeptidase [Gaoshiqia sediminis]MCW0481425.1 IgA Peptidase M64 [Gaoshiqia sediminis]
MKRMFPLIFLLTLPVWLNAQVSFSAYFEPASLRVDYLLAGTDSLSEVYLEQMKREPFFAGSTVNLIDGKNYGTYRYRVFDLKSGELIFSKGFCPLFQEWQTTAEASKLKRSYYQVAMLPFPKKEIRFTIESKNRDGDFVQLFSMEINPTDYFILNEPSPIYEVETVLKSGKPDQKVDLVFLPEGYTEAEMDKFSADVERMTNILFAAEPFNRHRSDFNIYAVKVPSAQSGTDVPGEAIYVNTAFGSSFYTFDTPRYLTTKDMKAIHDAAAAVPYDHIYLLVNSDRYGGGGFYNFLSVTTVDHEKAPQVLVHEFGHGFAGLADEYYSSEVAYDEFYNKRVEPWEPNITTLVDFDRKWKTMLDPQTPVPTPRESKYRHILGVFEGGGYSAKGIYSPMMNCRMKTNEAEGFCPVCQQAIEEAILWHCRE